MEPLLSMKHNFRSLMITLPISAMLFFAGWNSVTLAAEPLITTVAPGSQWSMEIDADRRKQAAEEKEEAPREISPTQLKVSIDTKGVEQRVLALSDGSTQTCYSINGVLYQAIPDSTEVLALPGSGLHALDPRELRVSGFPATAWIEKKYFVGFEKLNGVQCARYHRPAVADAEGGDVTGMTAWIREPERIPVHIQVGTSTYDFSPVTRFSGSVTLPPAVMQKAQAMERQNAALRRLAERERKASQ